MSGLLCDLCNLVLEGKRLLPLDVETDIGSTSVDDNSRGVQEWPSKDDGCPLISISLYHHEVCWSIQGTKSDAVVLQYSLWET